jgi:arabinofuranosyltransferase
VPIIATVNLKPRSSLALPIVVSITCSFLFIARTAFIVNGEYYFTLFDDAMISMRYARNLANGFGLVWNAGQPPVEGYTNFLWTLWMALLHLAGVPESKISLLVMISGALILIVNLVVVHRIAVRLAPGSLIAPPVAVWLTALYYPLVYWTLRGMEVGLVTLILSTSVLVVLRLRDRFRAADLITLAALMGAGILTRPDVLVPCIVVAAFAFLTAHSEHRLRMILVLGGTLVGTFAAHTTFRMVYYGALLPNTYYLKVSGASLDVRLARGLINLADVVVLHLVIPITLAAAYLIAGGPKSRHPGIYLLASIFLALCAYSAYVGGDAWDAMFIANRYVTPAMPGLLILTALALDYLVSAEVRLRTASIIGLVALFIIVAALNATAPASTLSIPATAVDERLRIVRAAFVLTPIAVLPFIARARLIAAFVLAVATLVAVDGFAVGLWITHNAFYADDDEWTTKYALALRAATAEDASIAVVWAGAIPYFSHRPAVDLLGKSDRIVATLARQPAVGFLPGHDKWDYAYSIGQLRPDVVAELWDASDEDIKAMDRWGYVRFAPWVFVLADSHRVDKAAVGKAVCVVLKTDPFILGSPTKSVANLTDLVARYCSR